MRCTGSRGHIGRIRELLGPSPRPEPWISPSPWGCQKHAHARTQVHTQGPKKGFLGALSSEGPNRSPSRFTDNAAAWGGVQSAPPALPVTRTSSALPFLCQPCTLTGHLPYGLGHFQGSGDLLRGLMEGVTGTQQPPPTPAVPMHQFLCHLAPPATCHQAYIYRPTAPTSTGTKLA